MEIAFIAPVPHVDTYGALTRYHMALTHLVEKYPDYARFFRIRRNRGEHVMLDNSVIELGDSLSLDRILAAAELTSASEIILPDTLDDSESTMEQANHYSHIVYKKYHHKPPFKLMAVAQGKTEESFLKCYRYLADHPLIDTIGIPKRASQLFPRSIGRMGIIESIEDTGSLNPGKPHHLLGIWQDPLELVYAKALPWIRGVDSQLPFAAGAHGIEFDFYMGSPAPSIPRINLEEPIVGNFLRHIVDRNILCMMFWAQNVSKAGEMSV